MIAVICIVLLGQVQASESQAAIAWDSGVVHGQAEINTAPPCMGLCAADTLLCAASCAVFGQSKSIALISQPVLASWPWIVVAMKSRCVDFDPDPPK